MAVAGSYRSYQDLITEALANLGVLSAGQPTDPEDYNYVYEKLDAIFRQLSALEICNVPDINNIPGAFFAPLADIVAGECAGKFGITGADLATIKQVGLGIPAGSGAAAMVLKQILRNRPTYETVISEFM